MPLSKEGISDLRAFQSYKLVQFIVSESEMTEALRQVATGKTGKVSDKAPPRKLIGDVLIEMKIINQAMLAKVIRHYDPDKDGRLGDFLVAKKVISERDLKRALAHQSGKAIPEIPVQPGSASGKKRRQAGRQ